jgi:hypothetical protein
LFVRWYADSQREARREDRRLDRLEAQRARAAAGPGYDRPASDRATSLAVEPGPDE